MKRRLLSLLATIAVLGASTVAADLPSAWRAWRYCRSIGELHYNGPAEIVIPADLFVHSENGLADLRLIDEHGSEVPYQLYAEKDSTSLIHSGSAILHENSFVPGKFTQIVLEVVKNPYFHNTLKIDTPEPEFMNWVEVAVSDDTHLWRIVNPRAPISRFRREGLEGSQTIHYPDASARFLRLRIEEPAHQFAVTGAQILCFYTRESDRSTIPAKFVADPSPPPEVTRWTADLESTGIPVTEADFITSTPEFFRAVRILFSSDGKEWETQSQGEIYRYKLANKIEESLRVRFTETLGARFWRLEILNGNDAPLLAITPSLIMTPRRIFFQPAPGQSYRLIYGNRKTTVPQYDLQKIWTYKGKPAALIIKPGPEESTENYADPRPFTARHSNLLWFALGLAVVLLGYAALRALRTPDSAA
jgi:Protein of unknown function (DUF3999)